MPCRIAGPVVPPEQFIGTQLEGECLPSHFHARITCHDGSSLAVRSTLDPKFVRGQQYTGGANRLVEGCQDDGVPFMP
jgi:hypothetical protein